MTRILLVETASPKRICHKAMQIRNEGALPEPEISILCQESSVPAFQALPGIRLYPIKDGPDGSMLKEINAGNFDVVFVFLTGEEKFRRLKWRTLRLKAKEMRAVAGDGNEFRLTWKALCRHTIFRWKHPLPTDHREFAAPKEEERVLIIQSAEPSYVLKALDRLREKPLFSNPAYTIFCRNRKEIVDHFSWHPMLSRILTHSETQGSWKHLRELRRLRFDAIVLLLTGDPSYWKIKYFAPLLGVPLKRLLIFNESLDCFFFNWSQWGALLSHRTRMQTGQRIGSSHPLRSLLSLILKSVVLPFRFFWLLLVWLRLRCAGMRSSRKGHDDSLRLPLFPGT
jgi:hypothetical protein